MPTSGKYQVSIEAMEGPSQAVVQLFRNEVAMGKPVDLFATERRKSAVIPMGVLEMNEGDNHLFVKLIGKHKQSAGLGFDLIRIIFEKVG
jgi:hypothetical protein